MDSQLTRYILDSSAIIANPEILARGGGDVTLIIPDLILDEIGVVLGSGKRGEIAGVILDAIATGSLTVDPTELSVRVFNAGGRRIVKGTDTAMTAYILQTARKDPSAVLVTNDRHFEPLRAQGINIISSRELLRGLPASQPTSSLVADQARRLSRRQWLGTISSFVFGAAVATLPQLVSGNWLLAHLEVLGLTGCGLLVLLVGCALYALRGRLPKTYGFMEIGIGIAGAINAVVRYSPTNEFDITIILQIVGSIYIVVRGLDNAGKGIAGTVVEKYWVKFFPRP